MTPWDLAAAPQGIAARRSTRKGASQVAEGTRGGGARVVRGRALN